MPEEFKMVPVLKNVDTNLGLPTNHAPMVTWQRPSGTQAIRAQHVLQVLKNHWLLLVIFVFAFTAALSFVTFSIKDTFEAVAQIEVEPPPAPTAFSVSGNALADTNEDEYMQTQIEVLKSNSLALAVVQKLHLDHNGEFVPQTKPYAWLSRKSSETPPEGTVAIDAALNSFHNKLTVEEVRNSRLVEVRFASHDPALAAKVANTLVELYLDKTYKSQSEAVEKASESVAPEMEKLRKGVEQANQAMVDFLNSTGIVETANNENAQAGANTGQTPISQRAIELNRQLTEAQTDRIQLESYLHIIEAGDGNSLPQMRDNPVLQDVTKRYGESRAQLAQALAIYGQNNSNVRKLQNEVDELGKQVAEERHRVVDQLKTSFQAALAHEQLLASAIAGMQTDINRMNKNLLQYNELKKRAQANSELYTTISSRLEEAAVAGSVNSDNIRVLDSATTPRRPVKPNRPQILVLGLTMSIILAVALAFVRDALDDNIYTPEDILTWTALPSLAMFPAFVPTRRAPQLHSSLRSLMEIVHNNGKNKNAARPKFFLERPGSEEAEAVRSLVTAIRVPSTPGERTQVILLVSPFSGEGKTTIAVNLATALAQHGKTCLVDADLRNPLVGRTFGLDAFASHGLTEVLCDVSPLDSALQPSESGVSGLVILPAGSKPSNPGELVSSQRMQDVLKELRKTFEHIVIDSPPIIPYADARSLSAVADAVVVVARSGMTKQRALSRATELLASFHAPVLGVVLNAVDVKSSVYYGYGPYGRQY